MIEKSNHLGTITLSKRYLISLVTAQAESCFGIAGLNKVEIARSDNAVSVKLNAAFSGDVNIPAVADAVSHKVAYELTLKTGIDVRSVEIFADEIISE